jgi:hypothetical protein
MKVIRAAMPNARVDVVLNAEDYTSWDQLKKRMEDIDGKLRPDLWFFDFYSKGRVDVMESAIRWAHNNKRRRQLLGGNFWATRGVPRGTDFLALDDHDGLQQMGHQAKQLRAAYPSIPLLAHIENNPQNPTTGDDERNTGFLWMLGFHPRCVANPAESVNEIACSKAWSRADRKSFLDKLRAGRTVGYSVMYPVNFPLIPTAKEQMLAYDAAADGMLATIDRMMP